MTRIKLLALIALALFVGGCQSFYTSIERAEDGTYTLTRFNQGLLTVYGSVESCTITETRMICREIAEE